MRQYTRQVEPINVLFGDLPMIRLKKALHAWGTPAFTNALKTEIEELDPGLLPLQQGLTKASYAVASNLRVMIISVSENDKIIRARVGIFYAGIIAGCSCADDPTPVEEQPEYCEVQLDMDKVTAESKVTLLV